jgi:hypothetical protein
MTMEIPLRVNTRWMSTLDDASVIEAESILHADFRQQDSAEKNRRGTRYRLLEGPVSLVDAWMRWSSVSNEARRRGLMTHHRS